MITVIGITCVFLALFYVWYRKTYSYWTKRKVYGPTPYPLIGTIYQLFGEDIRTVDARTMKKYGPLYGQYVGTLPSLTICDPDLMKQVLINDFATLPIALRLSGLPKPLQLSFAFNSSEHWKRLRSSISPSFSSAKLKRLLVDFEQPMQTLKKNLNNLIKTKNTNAICIKDLCKSFAFDTVVKYVLSLEIDSFAHPNDPFVVAIWKLIQPASLPFLISSLLPEWAGFLIKPFLLDMKAYNYLRSAVLSIVRERQQNPSIQHRDFLQLLIDSQSNLNDDELVAQVHLFFFAGLDTTATAFSLILADLAHYPDVQEKLYLEIMENVESNETFTFESLNEMSYLNAVMTESLRRTPLSNNITRYPIKNYTLPGYNIPIDANILVRLNVFNAHHSPKYYSDPYEYQPERFLGEKGQELQKNAWFAFSNGPRNCVGMRLGQLKIKYFLYHIIRDYKVKMSPNSEWPIKYSGTLFTVIPDSLSIEFHPRL